MSKAVVNMIKEQLFFRKSRWIFLWDKMYHFIVVINLNEFRLAKKIAR